MDEVSNEKATNRVPDLAEQPRAREDVVFRQADEEWVAGKASADTTEGHHCALA